MLGTFKKSSEHLRALDRVKQWTRDRFELSEDAAILVSEVKCTYPGCVPLETVVGFWTEGSTHHHFKLFKPVMEVAEDDLPPAWLKDALIVTEEFRCSCC